MSKQYRVYLTPRISLTTYGTEIEITDYVLENSISEIRRGIDTQDYDVGLYQYGDIRLTLENRSGIFGNEQDSRTVFFGSRELSKIRIVHNEISVDAENVVTETNTVTFKGIIHEEATRLDIENHTIQFRVMGLDSVFLKVKVSAGAIATGTTADSAIRYLLNRSSITGLLTFDPDKISVDQDVTIDDGSYFDNKTTKVALDGLLFATNSVLYIDHTDSVVVSPRTEDSTISMLRLYGKGEIHRRENIVSIKNFNQGQHRLFTAVEVNDRETSDADYVSEFGYRKKAITLDFITSTASADSIAARVLREFKHPKKECEVTCPSSAVASARILQRVTIDYGLRLTPIEGKRFPVCGQFVCGDANTPLPYTEGSVYFYPSLVWKIIEIRENPRDLLTTLKLRQLGTSEGETVSAVILMEFAAIVGSTTDVTDSLATHSSLATAISDVAAGDAILILCSYNSSENGSIDKQVMIQGAGRGSRIAGTFTFAAGSSFSRITNIRVTDNITIADAVNGVQLDGVWLASGKTVTPGAGTGHSIQTIEE